MSERQWLKSVCWTFPSWKGYMSLIAKWRLEAHFKKVRPESCLLQTEDVTWATICESPFISEMFTQGSVNWGTLTLTSFKHQTQKPRSVWWGQKMAAGGGVVLFVPVPECSYDVYTCVLKQQKYPLKICVWRFCHPGPGGLRLTKILLQF